MRVALVAQEYPPQTAKGGIGSQTYIKAHGLAKRGYEIFVISRSLSDRREEQTQGKVTVIRVPGLEDRLPDMTEPVRWMTNSVMVAGELNALHQRIGLDLIDFPDWGAEGYVYLLNRTAWNFVPCVIHLHGPLVMFAHAMGWPEINSEFYRVGTHMESTCVRLADRVYSSSECSAQWIRSHYHYQNPKIPVIHMGVDTDVFTVCDVAKNVYPTILYVGSLAENKGVYDLVAAAGRLTGEIPDLRLRLVGSGDPNVTRRLHEIADASGVSGFLETAGYVSRDDLPEEFCRAHVFASPSHYEGGPGFTFLEAMACGLPVIGCSGSGVDEIVTSEKNGILVPPRDADALFDALKRLLSQDSLRKNMGQSGREFVCQEADTEACLDRLESFYQSVFEYRHGTSKEL